MSVNPNIPILVVHSSCREGLYETNNSNPSSYNEMKASYKDDDINNDDSVYDKKKILEQPITCDLLLLPEYQHNSDGFSDYSPSLPRSDIVHFPRNDMNPCGFPNVITLENLPNRWKTGPVLLSLLSCSIPYDTGNDRNINGNETTSQSYNYNNYNRLPVEPSPPTFVLEFSKIESEEEVDRVSPETNSKANEILTFVGNKLTEISVDFDFTEAFKKQNEILLYEELNHVPGPVIDKGGRNITKVNYDSKESNCRRPTKNQYEKCSEQENKDEPFYTVDTNSNGNNYNLTNDHRLLLLQLNAQLKSDARTMDQLIHICGFVSLSLTVILLWTVYQYCRSSVKSDAFSKEVCESSKKSRQVLEEAILGLSLYQQKQQVYNESGPFKNNVPNKDSDTPKIYAKPDDDDDNNDDDDDEDKKGFKNNNDGHPTTIEIEEFRDTNSKPNTLISGRKGTIWDELAKEKERRAALRAKLCNHNLRLLKTGTIAVAAIESQVEEIVTSDNKSDTKLSNGSISIASSQIPKNFTTPQRENEKSDNDIERKDAVSNTPKIGKSSRNNSTPIQSRQPRVDRSTKNIPHAISPCGLQLSKEWNEGKKIRGSNLTKIRRPLLQDSVQDSVCGTIDSSLLSHGSPFPVSPPSTTKWAFDNLCQNQQFITNHQSLDGKNESITSSNGVNVGNKFKFTRTENTKKIPPPVPFLPQSTPYLCYTPASEDDSFVDDYW